MVITVGLQIKLLQMYPSFQGAISQNHILHLILHEFSALFALKQRKGLLMFSLSSPLYLSPIFSVSWSLLQQLSELSSIPQSSDSRQLFPRLCS